MKTRIAIEFTGYNGHKHFLCAGTAIDRLDLTAQIQTSYSLGWDEPIYDSGLGNRYATEEIDVPEWLYDGMVKYYRKQWDGGEYPEGEFNEVVLDRAAQIAYNDFTRSDLFEALRYLALATTPGKFQRSLMEWWKEHGFLTTKQINAVLNPPNFRRR